MELWYLVVHLVLLKNKAGTGECDSYMENNGYYLKTMTDPTPCLACFLVDLVGPRIEIHGAVFTSTVCVDTFLFHCYSNQIIDRQWIQIGRTYKALWNAMQRLQQFYSRLSATKDISQLSKSLKRRKEVI